MDLKFYKGKILLHLIDYATRSSGSHSAKWKEPQVILDAIFKSWIQIYSAPEKLLTDNTREFANSKFIGMAESMYIVFKVTAAESPFSNGLVERHNIIIADMMEKVLGESHLNIDLTLAWCLNAKNPLAKVHGFSTFQFAFGLNPKLPSTFGNKSPALIQHDTSKILRDNLTGLHKLRQAFISSESSKKIHRDLNNSMPTRGETKYVTGDSVYFKKLTEKCWRDLGNILGQDRQQVLVQYGSSYVLVHPCQLSLARNASNNLNPNTVQNSADNR